MTNGLAAWYMPVCNCIREFSYTCCHSLFTTSEGINFNVYASAYEKLAQQPLSLHSRLDGYPSMEPMASVVWKGSNAVTL